MALRDWISRSGRSATATVATLATLETSGAVTVATVATVAVASVEKDLSENRGLTPVLDGLHPCPLCGGGLFNEGSKGGYFCVACQSLSEGAHVVRVVRGITPRQPQKIYPEPVPAVSRKKLRHLLSPIALQWLRDHCQELDAVGWSRPDLYRRSGYRPGLVWYAPWTKASSISLDQATGAIVFSWMSNGREIVQRALPPPPQNRPLQESA